MFILKCGKCGQECIKKTRNGKIPECQTCYVKRINTKKYISSYKNK